MRVTTEADRTRLRACRKKPWTVAWIEREIRTGDVVWDVGANVGASSLLAACARQATGYAFEPGFATYAALCDNVALNGLGALVRPLPVALGATTTVSSRGLRSFESGAAIHAMAGARGRTCSSSLSGTNLCSSSAPTT